LVPETLWFNPPRKVKVFVKGNFKTVQIGTSIDKHEDIFIPEHKLFMVRPEGINVTVAVVLGDSRSDRVGESNVS
jgi:hypothetical protein